MHKNNVGEEHFVARWGGEEFVIVLPNTSTDESFTIAENIRKAVTKVRFGADKPVTVTISSGVGSSQPDEDFASCFKRVDVAMFDAKKLGRNCTQIATTLPVES